MIYGIFYSVKDDKVLLILCWDRQALLLLENVLPSIDYRDFIRPKIKPFFMLRA